MQSIEEVMKLIRERSIFSEESTHDVRAQDHCLKELWLTTDSTSQWDVTLRNQICEMIGSRIVHGLSLPEPWFDAIKSIHEPPPRKEPETFMDATLQWKHLHQSRYHVYAMAGGDLLLDALNNSVSFSETLSQDINPEMDAGVQLRSVFKVFLELAAENLRTLSSSDLTTSNPRISSVNAKETLRSLLFSFYSPSNIESTEAKVAFCPAMEDRWKSSRMVSILLPPPDKTTADPVPVRIEGVPYVFAMGSVTHLAPQAIGAEPIIRHLTGRQLLICSTPMVPDAKQQTLPAIITSISPLRLSDHRKLLKPDSGFHHHAIWLDQRTTIRIPPFSIITAYSFDISVDIIADMWTSKGFKEASPMMKKMCQWTEDLACKKGRLDAKSLPFQEEFEAMLRDFKRGLTQINRERDMKKDAAEIRVAIDEAQDSLACLIEEKRLRCERLMVDLSSSSPIILNTVLSTMSNGFANLQRQALKESIFGFSNHHNADSQDDTLAKLYLHRQAGDDWNDTLKRKIILTVARRLLHNANLPQVWLRVMDDLQSPSSINPPSWMHLLGLWRDLRPLSSEKWHERGTKMLLMADKRSIPIFAASDCDRTVLNVDVDAPRRLAACMRAMLDKTKKNRNYSIISTHSPTLADSNHYVKLSPAIAASLRLVTSSVPRDHHLFIPSVHISDLSPASAPGRSADLEIDLDVEVPVDALPRFETYPEIPTVTRTVPTVPCRACITPAGTYTLGHTEYRGGESFVQHLRGKKLWVCIPLQGVPIDVKLANAVVWNEEADQTDIALELLSRPDVNAFGLWMDEGATFTLPPFCIHAVFSFDLAFHIGGPIWTLKGLTDSKEILLEILRKTTKTKPDVVKDVCHEIQVSMDMWTKLLGKKVMEKLGTIEKAMDELKRRSEIRYQ